MCLVSIYTRGVGTIHAGLPGANHGACHRVGADVYVSPLSTEPPPAPPTSHPETQQPPVLPLPYPIFHRPDLFLASLPLPPLPTLPWLNTGWGSSAQRSASTSASTSPRKPAAPGTWPLPPPASPPDPPPHLSPASFQGSGSRVTRPRPQPQPQRIFSWPHHPPSQAPGFSDGGPWTCPHGPAEASPGCSLQAHGLTLRWALWEPRPGPSEPGLSALLRLCLPQPQAPGKTDCLPVSPGSPRRPRAIAAWPALSTALKTSTTLSIVCFYW